MKKRNYTLNIFLSVVLIGLACQKSSDSNAQRQSGQQAPVASGIETDELITAKVTLVKFSDYQCPACKVYFPFVNQLKQDYGDDIRVVYKHFPLSIHPYAHVAARSVEAARLQGKFQEMHDMIFQGQEQWSQGNAEAIFIGYANTIGLNVDQFRSDMNSADMNRIVMADRREGRDLNVNSTPTFYVNGEEMISVPRTYPEFKAIIDQYMD